MTAPSPELAVKKLQQEFWREFREMRWNGTVKFPEWVKTTKCEWRSHSIIHHTDHGAVKVVYQTPVIKEGHEIPIC